MSELLREKEKRQKEIKREREKERKVTFGLLGSGFVLVARHGGVWIRKGGSHKRRAYRGCERGKWSERADTEVVLVFLFSW
jgi:hypothetical protein